MPIGRKKISEFGLSEPKRRVVPAYTGGVKEVFTVRIYHERLV